MLWLSWTAGLAQTAAPVASPQLVLSAIFQGDNRPIQSGLIWRVYRLDAQMTPTLAAQSIDAAPRIELSPGEYVVHVAFGLASASRKVLIGQGPTVERVPIGGGALIVRASIAGQPIPAQRLAIRVFIPAPGNAESRMVADALRSGDALRLPEGTYHVVSSYGDSNSIVRADIRVTSGKVIEATMLHRAATITLKLVSAPGGEAIADTAWSVLTPGGDVIREALGAFPSMTLAEGEYVAIARHAGRVYQGEFRVRTGDNRDVEVLASESATAPTRAN